MDSALASWDILVTQPEPVTGTVEEVSGVLPRTFRQWVLDHMDDFQPPPTEIAVRYVSSFRAGDLDAALRLLSPDVVRVAPMEAAGGPAELRGLRAIMDHSQRLNAGYQIHGVAIDGPFVHQDSFAVRFVFDQTPVSTGRRTTTAKMSLYTVSAGAIEREEVYYHTAPHAPEHGD